MEKIPANLVREASKDRRDQDHLIVSVRDFGIGMTRDHQDKLFERFYQVDHHSHRFQGTGLGLFISSEIIQRHRGNFDVESEPEKGSVFSFCLPLNA